jgi:hypothetical protein
VPLFYSQVYHLPSDAVLAVEVEYEMRDCGVMMGATPNVQPVLLSVRKESGVELLEGIDEEQLVDLRKQAREFDNAMTEWLGEAWRSRGDGNEENSET